MNTKWNDFTKEIKGKRLIGYGAGSNAALMLMNEKFQPYIHQVDYFVDRDCNKDGKKIKSSLNEIDIYPISKLDELDKESIVIVTISDYIKVGKMLDEKGIKWFAWTIVSTAFNFKKLEELEGNTTPKIFLLNTPDYINLGDQAIAVAEDIYIKENFGDYYEFGTHSCHSEALEDLKRYVSEKDIIFFQGGGNLGSLWRVCEEIFRDVLQKFPNNKIIVFPQSVYYGESLEEQEYFFKSQKIYNEHKNLLICVRDQRSYDFVTTSYTCECILLPDMVLTLCNKIEQRREGVGILLRDDKEKLRHGISEQTIKKVVDKMNQEVIMLTHHPVEVLVNREDRIKRLLNQYASCKLVITDRLHGMIFSAITNTPCIAFDNIYHKVSGVYKAWLSECSHISFVSECSEDVLLELIQDKLDAKYKEYDAQIYKEKFKELTKLVKELL